MFYRLLVITVVLFWAWMTAQLIRTEIFPQEGKSLPVPVAFVTKLVFHHEQTADLNLFSQGRRLDGALHLLPKRLRSGVDGRETPLNLFTANGSFALSLPGINAQRIVFRAMAELTDQQQFQRLELTASLHEAKQSGPGLTLYFEGKPVRDEWHYILRQGEEVIREDTGPMSKLLANADPHIPGLSLGGFEQMQRQQSASTHVSAHRSSLRVSGEPVETFEISVQQGDVVQATIHFNQLGQILAIKTFVGYDLYDEGVSP